MTNTFLSASVVAAVLFYGGTLVLRGSMSAGSLVSFMLFQQSLSSAFQVGRRPGCAWPPATWVPGCLDALLCVCVACFCWLPVLTDGFASLLRPQALGDVFSALSAAVGAADKVIELMKRQPRVAERGTLAPTQFAGKITLQARLGGGAWVCGSDLML